MHRDGFPGSRNLPLINWMNFGGQINNKSEGGMRRLKLPLLFVLMLVCVPVMATTYYLDSSVSSSGNGGSWASAWKNFSDIKGLRPGDTVFISGGSSGQAYTTGNYLSPSGASGSPITYKVGQDAGHNGIVTINYSGGSYFIYGSASQGYGQWNTWDGNVGGQIHLIINSGATAVYAQGIQGLILRYLQTSGQISEYGSSNMEIDHILFIDSASNHLNDGNAVQCPNGGSGYTSNLIHDSTFRLRQHRNNDGLGTDGFKWCGNVSIYNNNIVGILDASYSDGQHQDGIQFDGSNVAFYNNYVENMQNYAVYWDIHDSSSTSAAHLRLYNNVIYGPQSSPGGSKGFALGCENVSSCSMTDATISNNTLVSLPNCMGLNDGNPQAAISTFNVVNNICYSAGSIHVMGSGITLSNNTTSNTGIAFVNSASDWHLTSSATAAIGKGIDPSYLSSAFTTDMDGNTRTVPWDIGAYKFGSGQPPAPPTALTAAPH